MLKGRKNIVLFSVITIICLLVACAFGLFLRFSLIDKYEDAKKLFEKKEYYQASEYFKALGDYEESAEYLKKSEYQIAIQLYDAGNFKQAYEYFTSLGGYKDSIEYAAKAQLGDMDRLKEIVYKRAERLFNEKNYESAIEEYSTISDYKDSLDKIQKCKDAIKRLEMAHTVYAGMSSVLGISEDDTILYTKGNYSFDFSSWNNQDIVSICVGDIIAAGLRSDGSVIATVAQDSNEKPDISNVESWHDIIAISAGERYVVALRNDGKVFSTANTTDHDHQGDVGSWENIIAIATGWRHTVGLDKNGEIHIAGAGNNLGFLPGKGSNSLQNIMVRDKENWKDIVAIDAGGGGKVSYVGFIVGLKENGSVIVAYDETGPYKDYRLNQVEEWKDIVAIAAGEWHIIGLDKNGKIWSTMPDPTADLKSGSSTEEDPKDLDTSCCKVDAWSDISMVAISAGPGTTIGIDTNNQVHAIGYSDHGQTNAKKWENIKIYK